MGKEIGPGKWVICETPTAAGLQRFTAQVQGSYLDEGSRVYQVQAELPAGNPTFRLPAQSIVSVF